MIEQIMYIGIGFLIAGLLVIGVIPLVHGRAVRLTAKRIEALNPISMAEIQAQKDQLRAEFAMSTRRLEMTVEQLKARNTSQLSELGKKNDAISRLKFELGEKAAALLALEAKEKQLADERASAQEVERIENAVLRENINEVAAEIARITAALEGAGEGVRVPGLAVEGSKHQRIGRRLAEPQLHALLKLPHAVLLQTGDH